MTRKYSPKNGSIHCSEIQTQVYLRMLYSYALLIFFIFLYGLKKYLKNPKQISKPKSGFPGKSLNYIFIQRSGISYGNSLHRCARCITSGPAKAVSK